MGFDLFSRHLCPPSLPACSCPTRAELLHPSSPFGQLVSRNLSGKISSSLRSCSPQQTIEFFCWTKLKATDRWWGLGRGLRGEGGEPKERIGGKRGHCAAAAARLSPTMATSAAPPPRFISPGDRRNKFSGLTALLMLCRMRLPRIQVEPIISSAL